MAIDSEMEPARHEKRLYESILAQEGEGHQPSSSNASLPKRACVMNAVGNQVAAAPDVVAIAEPKAGGGYRVHDLEGKAIQDMGATMCLEVSQGEGKHSDWYRANDRSKAAGAVVSERRLSLPLWLTLFVFSGWRAGQ